MRSSQEVGSWDIRTWVENGRGFCGQQVKEPAWSLQRFDPWLGTSAGVSHPCWVPGTPREMVPPEPPPSSWSFSSLEVLTPGRAGPPGPEQTSLQLSGGALLPDAGLTPASIPASLDPRRAWGCGRRGELEGAGGSRGCAGGAGTWTPGPAAPREPGARGSPSVSLGFAFLLCKTLDQEQANALCKGLE